MRQVILVSLMILNSYLFTENACATEATQCVQLLYQQREQLWVTIHNGCSVSITVNWCYSLPVPGTDGGTCKSGKVLKWPLAPGDQYSFPTAGTIYYAACVYPQDPHMNSIDINYSCY